MNKKVRAGYGFYFLLVMVLIFAAIWVSMNGRQDATYTEAEFREEVEEENVLSITIRQNREVPTGSVVVTFNDMKHKIFNVSDVNRIEKYAEKNEIPYLVEDVPEENWFLQSVLPALIVVVAIVFLYVMIGNAGASGGGNSRLMNFGKSRAQLITDCKVTFNDVAGLAEEKEDLNEIVDFLKNPAKYNKLGARIPKGVLLEGRPGTGKTLLAKAIAGEAPD